MNNKKFDISKYLLEVDMTVLGIPTYTKIINTISESTDLSTYSEDDLYRFLGIASLLRKNASHLVNQADQIYKLADERLQSICDHNFIKDMGDCDPCRSYYICTKCQKYR